MKISYVTMQFPAPSETFASNDILTLKQLGNEVSVYSMKAKNAEHNNMIKSRNLTGIPIFNSGIIEVIIGLFEILKSPSVFVKLLSWLIKNDIKKKKHFLKCFLLIPSSFFILFKLKKQKPDIVHLFWGHYPSLVGFLIKHSMPEVKLSIFLGAYDLTYNLGISKSIATKADFIFTHSFYNIKIMKDFDINENKINIIHRGINVSKLIPIINGVERKKINSWFSAGRLLKSKNFDKVIHAFYKYNLLQNDSTLAIAGDGCMLKNLKQLSHDLDFESKISFTGFLSQTDILIHMAQSDIFMLLSTKPGERLPNVIKEAMLAGCICISSYSPGIEELIKHNENGFIINENDYEEIANIINSLTYEKKEKIKYNAQKYINKNFNVEIQMKKYLNIWSYKKDG